MFDDARNVARHIGNESQQTTLLVQGAGGFKPVSGDVIQILHDRDHWLACASIRGILYMADSAHRLLSHVVGQQLKQLFPSRVRENGELPVYVLPSATQPNGSDCGVYDAAFAFQWASGTMACDVQFDSFCRAYVIFV